jgi:signal transduction histidine kinase
MGRASAAIEAAIYFCAREAIQNATKHAGPGVNVTAKLARRRGMIDLTINDNGLGISTEAAGAGIGIRSMRDRIDAVDGQLDIFSKPGLGTCIHGGRPVQAPGWTPPTARERQPARCWRAGPVRPSSRTPCRFARI